jgi:hypothetical protein
MNIRPISIETYMHVAHDDDFDCIETVTVGGCWPISIGRSPFYPGKRILIGHVQNGAFIAELANEAGTDA